MKKAVLIFSVLFLVAACGRGTKGTTPAPRAFGKVSVPALVTDPSARLQYVLEHYWDSFFEGTGPTDDSFVLGVPKDEFEKALSTFCALMLEAPGETVEKAAQRMFDSLEMKQAEDTANHIYPVVTGMVAKYFYDPNSPLRDEDVYLPFVRRMAESRFTDEDSRVAYRFEAKMCALNPRGSEAPDFEFRDLQGRTGKLSDIRADHIILFFSNPGCQACKDIEDELKAPAYMEEAVKSGKIAVVSIYIDSEIDKWKAYAPSYPDYWVAGYDAAGRIRSGNLYEVRAIPSLYLLDKDRRIVLKDAPTARALRYIENN